MRILCIVAVIECYFNRYWLSLMHQHWFQAKSQLAHSLVSYVIAEFHCIFIMAQEIRWNWKSCRFHVCGNVQHTLICTRAHTSTNAFMCNIIKVIYYVCVINLNEAFSPVVCIFSIDLHALTPANYTIFRIYLHLQIMAKPHTTLVLVKCVHAERKSAFAIVGTAQFNCISDSKFQLI